jgi:hypothetical protein
MLWQALSGMYFRLAGGYPPLSPDSYRAWPVIRSSEELATIPDVAEQWKAFAANHGVTAVILSEVPAPGWVPSTDPIVAALGQPVVSADGISLYHVQPEMLAPYRRVGWKEMEALADVQRFDALLVAADRYLASQADAARLSPRSVADMGLPPPWLNMLAGTSDYRVYLHAQADGRIGVGVSGTYEALRAVINRYGTYASRIYFPSPLYRLGQISPPANDPNYRPLVMIFDRTSLDRAAALAVKYPPTLNDLFDSQASRTALRPRHAAD